MRLEATHGIVGESLGQDSSFSSMQILVNGAVSAIRSWIHWKCRIEIGFFDIGFESIDLLQCRIGVYGKTVRSVSNEIAVLLVKTVEIKVSSAIPGLMDGIPVCETSKKRSRILC